MKSYNNLWEPMLEHDNIKLAFINPAKKKGSRPDVKAIFDNLEFHIKVVHDMLEKDEYRPRKHRKVIINENSSKKHRSIEKPDYKYEQVIHHVVMQVLIPIIKEGMYEFTCGSIPGKGPHYGKKYIEKWIQTDFKNTKYVFKCDIKHFYDSIDQDVLKAWLLKKIRDKRFLKLLFLIIESCDKGIPLGFYTSQWFANFLLQTMDHYIKEKLGAVYYIRYMDDMVVFGRNKRELHKIKEAVNKFLEEELHLQMKGNWQAFRFDYVDKKTGKRKGRPLDFMGFQFYRDKTTIRKSIMLSATRKARRIGKKSKITWVDASSMLSYMGWVTHTDSYDMYERHIKPYVNIKQLKKIISKHQRKVNRIERLENSKRNPSRNSTRTRPYIQSNNCIST